MSADHRSLRDRYLDDLRSGSFPVLLAAVPFAMLALFASYATGADESPAFLLAVTIGVLVPYAHERYWPQDRPWHRDAAWTLVAAVASAALLTGAFVALESTFGDATLAPVVAFVLTAALVNAVAWWAGRRFDRSR